MRSMLILVLLSCFMVQGLSRPSRLEEDNDGEREDAEYETGSDAAVAEDNSVQGDDDAMNEQETSADNEDEEATRNQQMQYGGNAEFRHAAFGGRSRPRDNTDNLPDYKVSRNSDLHEEKVDDSAFSNKEYQSILEPRHSKYNENDANDEAKTQHLSNRDVNNLKQQNDEGQVNKRMFGSHTAAANEEADFLFENNDNNRQSSLIGASRSYNNKPADSTEQSRDFKQYYRAMQAENRDDKYNDNERPNVSRDRRQADGSTSNLNLISTSSDNAPMENDVTENEEAAIKRHVRKLTGEELEELLNSLSLDKRELLKKIMDSDNSNSKDSINKREITKKAGAAEEINLDGGQSDSSKLQGVSSSIDMNTGTPTSTGPTESNKPTETPSQIPDIMATKTIETSNVSANSEKAELANHIDDSSQDMSSCGTLDSKKQVNIDASNQATSKTENKREANLDDLDVSFDNKMIQDDFGLKDSDKFLNDQGYDCNQDNDLSQLLDDESQLHNNANTYKRETFMEKDSDISDSIKSLEESFPNSNAYDDADPYAGSDMAPLVRVKRTNGHLIVNKRAAALLPDAKVAYFPYRAENDDEDNNEGNEFDNEGFYDRISSLAKNRAEEKPLYKTGNNFDTPCQRVKSTNINSESNVLQMKSKGSPNENIESDTSLGSDNDSVLSGIEGVDDNLMYNSGSRSRRTLVENPKPDTQAEDNTDMKPNHPLHSTLWTDDEGKESYTSAKYQESDAFGPLPHNYEGELSRSKRIRRVKQPPTSLDVAASNVY